ncbi:MAG: histidinol-phosphate transaminase [Chromatiales bacterium]|nr:MAG: histidinol-phosphate transaminase [Chromatiales bacterium]
MNGLTALFRPELRSLQAYRAATYESGLLRLNANEVPWASAGAEGLNRYPPARPDTLTARLADHYGVGPERVLVTRGSSEAIELLVRAVCRPGQDDIVICPPTFGMYAHYAQVQGAGIVEVPLLADAGYTLDVSGVQHAWNERTRLAFLCSPNNPTGNVLAVDDIAALCDAVATRGLVVVDAAYAEFAPNNDALMALLDRYPQLVVLRTLSKALGLAGVRCGALLSSPDVVDMTGRILPPYAIPVPCETAVLAALEPAARAAAQAQLARIRHERERLSARLAALPGVRRVWPSDANFILLEARDAAALAAAAKAGGVLIRDFSDSAWTPGCLRITVGRPQDNDQLLAALEA